jgi:hypothetical protein
MWDADDIPNDVIAFVHRCVRSVGHLETLLYLYEQRERAWSAIEISRQLRTNEAMAESQLTDLCSQAIERSNGLYQYSANPKNEPVLAKLDELYRERRHAVIHLIYSQPPDALRSFADAFKIKKD